MPSVSIIGAGNVAWVLGKRLVQRKWNISQIHARNSTEGEKLAKSVKAEFCPSLQKINPKVDVIIVAVSDDAIKEVASKLPNTKALVAHCSGSTPLSALPQVNRAVIWPLRSIAIGQRMTWKDLNMVMEADTDLASIRALDLIEDCGARPVKMDSKERKTAHLVAVILNNFSNHLLHMADVLCAEQNMDRQIFQDLMAHTLEYSGPAIASQTGPAARQDKKVLARQTKLLKSHPHFAEVYRAVSESIMKENHE